jgi:hypothetical protein
MWAAVEMVKMVVVDSSVHPPHSLFVKSIPVEVVESSSVVQG